jgi:5-(carboxyamino)imidazole ribonucleotide mutase
MPRGVPVGTLAIGTSGAANAGLLAAAILARKYPTIRNALAAFRQAQTDAVGESPE